MASEIRVNKINNRVGLGTVTYTDTGIIVSGISTATNFKTGSSNLHSTGLTVGNSFLHTTGIEIAGINVNGADTTIGLGATIYNSGAAVFTGVVTATQFKGDGSQLSGIDASALKFGASTKVQATNTGAVVTGILTATSFSGTLAASNLTGALPAISGANLTNLPPSAPVGGASTNTVFFENAKEVAVNYQITSTKNAMSAGPIAINAGIAVTVPSGCAWTIV